MAREPDFPVGYLVPGEYVLEVPLGAGQDGEVWRALKRSLKKTFAIKFLNAVEDKDKIKRFDTEIEILASLHHPNIISISDKNEAFNPKISKIVPFYVMEFLEGLPLNTYLTQCPAKKIFHIFCSLVEQTAMALSEVHSNGLSHGDIKPANLMIVQKTGTAVLTDFGFGLRRGDDNLGRTEYPKSSYRAPKGLTSQQADVYRLGRTFLEALEAISAQLTNPAVSELRQLLMPLTEEPSEAALDRAMSRLDIVRENVSKQNFAQTHFEELTARIPELSTSPKGSIISDPVHGFITLTDRAKAIVDLPQFQRLRRLKDVPECELVFPAMSQSRFECGLGAFAQTVQYIRKLADLPRFRSATDAAEISIALAGCLLAELGQYPFSHVVYQAAEQSRQLAPRVRSAHLVVNEPISEIIETQWGIYPPAVADLLLAGEAKRPEGTLGLISDLLDGPISAAHVDRFLRTASRISMHHPFDAPRFIHSIQISSDYSLALPSRRLDALTDLSTLKYSLAERVYGHKTARSARSMLLHAFSEMRDLEDLLELDDDGFLETCIARASDTGLDRSRNLLSWYRARKLHKRLIALDAETVRLGWRSSWRLASRPRIAVRFSVALEYSLAKLCGIAFAPGSVVFDLGDPVGTNVHVPAVDANGNTVSDLSEFPTILSITRAAERILSVPILFVSADLVTPLQNLGLEKLSDIIYSSIRDFASME
jgi:HD superfamily phosphohydrolase